MAIVAGSPTSVLSQGLLVDGGSGTVPDEGDVRVGVSYGTDGTEFTGTLLIPGVSNVRSGISYGADGTEFTGTLVVGAGGGGIVITRRGGMSM